MILFYKNGNTLKIHNPSAETKYYQMPSVNSVLATEDDLTKVTTVSSAIKQPVILTPANNSTGFNGDITFTGFETIETFTGTLDAISIAIATDINFANVVVLQRVETTDAGSFNIAVDLSSSDLYIKVKYHSDLYSSVWSNPVKTTTPEYIINKPTIIGPVNGATGVALFPMISGSDFTYVGVDETHESTTYQIAKDVAFTNIAYNVTSTTDLTSHLITEDLDYETTYYIRMRYNGSKYGNSEWSDTVTVSTVALDERIITLGTGNNIAGKTLKLKDGGYLISYYKITTTGTANYTVDSKILTKLDKNFNVVKSVIISVVDNINDFEEDDDGSIFLITIKTVGTLLAQTQVTKLDSNLNIVKSITISGTSSYGNSGRVKLLDGYVYIIGTINGHSQGTLYRFNKNLEMLKKIYLSSATFGNTQFRSIAKDKYGNIYLYGFLPDAQNYIAGSIIKLDSDMNVIKGTMYNTTATGIVYTMMENIVITDDDEIFMVGYVNSGASNTVGGAPSSTLHDPFIVKLDLELNTLVKKHIRDTNFGFGRGITLKDGFLYVTCTYYESSNGYDGKTIIYKMDKNLNVISSKSYDLFKESTVTDLSTLFVDNFIVLSGTTYDLTSNAYKGVILLLAGDFLTTTVTDKIYIKDTNPVWTTATALVKTPTLVVDTATPTIASSTVTAMVTTTTITTIDI